MLGSWLRGFGEGKRLWSIDWEWGCGVEFCFLRKERRNKNMILLDEWYEN